jgi:hypothetical protein
MQACRQRPGKKIAQPFNPNAETVAAMKAARRGERINAGRPDKLLRNLSARD